MQVQWEYEGDDGQFKAYHAEESCRMERSFQRQQEFIDFEEEFQGIALKTVRLNLRNFIEFPVDYPENTRRIRRKGYSTRTHSATSSS